MGLRIRWEPKVKDPQGLTRAMIVALQSHGLAAYLTADGLRIAHESEPAPDGPRIYPGQIPE